MKSIIIQIKPRICTYIGISSFLILAFTNSFGQIPDSETRSLTPNQTIEREMTGAETHRYKFELKANEFFQVRVEQKGVDVALNLRNADGISLATMDSPNGKEGPETLSFIADKVGGFILEVSRFDAKAEKGNYTIKCEISRMATENDKRRVKVEKSFVEGITAQNAGQGELAVEKLEEAVLGWKELNDSYLLDLSVQQINQIKINRYRSDIFGEFYQQLTNGRSALQEGQRLMSKSRADSLLAREKLSNSLQIHRALNSKIKVESETIAKKISQSGEFASQLNDEFIVIKFSSKLGEALSLNGIAQTHSNLQEWEANIDFLKQALNVYQEILSDTELKSNKESLISVKAVEASALAELGGKIDTYSGNSNESIKYLISGADKYNSLFSETQNTTYKFAEAQTLSRIGIVYGRQAKEYVNSLKYYRKALEIYRAYPDKKYEIASTLDLIGTRQSINFEYQPALENWEKALQNYREINYKMGQSSILHSISLMYWVLNNKSKLSETVNQWLGILQSPDFVENTKQQMDLGKFEVLNEIFGEDIESTRLSRIAMAYRFIENYPKALEYQEKSLNAVKNKGNPSEIRYNLYSLGLISSKLGKWDDAVKYYKSTLDISRQQGIKEEIADDLTDVGWVLLETGKAVEALKYQNEAFLIYQSIGVSENGVFVPKYTNLLNETSRSHYALGNERLAIFYGKRAVNAMQGERQRLQNLDLASQKGFLERKEKDYRRLADWLIEEGKFAQAEQVLAMLKQEEFFDFVRRDAGEVGKLDERVPLNEKEKTLVARYSLLADGQEFTKLDDKKRQLSRNDLQLSAEEQARYTELEKQLDDANAAFQLFLSKELVAEIGEQKTKEIEIDRNLQDKLRKWGDGTVALYTVAGADRYRVVLTTPKVQVDGKTEIKIADLNKKVFAFRAALQNPNVDPRPLGKELYDILIKPIEKELKAANAKTLIWSLDGTLRYIPLAALSPDGKRYLVEDVQNVIITPKTRDDLTNSDANWQALGLGVSEAETVANPDDKTRNIPFNPLPGTERELLSIVKDEKSPNETGVLTGRRFMNKDFTVANFKDALTKETADGKRKFNLIHIASHFRLGSNWTNSFLLLGNGETLSLEEINNSSTINFGDVDLITLSACNTGFADDTNGKEIDSLASVIQTKSGKAVLATLWAVADESTSLLMSEFYRLRKENPKITKAEAIQLAQKAMIEGKLQSAAETAKNRAEIVADPDSKTTAPPFAIDKTKPFAHPYYWSPFVLIGNWR